MTAQANRNIQPVLITQNHGFTLVETVITIIILAILAVSVLPKFLGSSDYTPYTYRDQMLSALRLQQTKAMQQTNGLTCHQLLITSTKFGQPDTNACSLPTLPSFSNTWQAWDAATNTGVSITNLAVASNDNVSWGILSLSGNQTINFDSLGRPTESCAGGCSIVITGNESTTIKIEAQGYIHVD